MQTSRAIPWLAIAGIAWATLLSAQPASDPPPPPSLKTVAVPRPPNLRDFVADEAAALRLGKALFWDTQLGSDGRVACATCHFHAGADSRSRNQVNPGLRRREPGGGPAPDRTFDLAPNLGLSAAHFPLRQLSDPNDRASQPARDTNDIIASQGVFNTQFVASAPGSSEETVLRPPDPDGFSVGGLNVRRVEPRNTPSVINAVFNHRNFWDGRAQNEFNGVSEWGDRDPDARVYRATPKGLEPVRVRLVNASLASQAVAPIINSTEQSASTRTAADLGRKLGKKAGKLQPLAGQLVHRTDSVLGLLSRSPQPGLAVNSYEELVRKAFDKQWHDSKALIRVADDGSVTIDENGQSVPGTKEYTLMQYNFPLFFGLAIQLYESTLVSDDTPYDRWREGRGTLSPEALVGLEVFLGQVERTLPDGKRRAGGRCINCHAGPEFTDASVSSIALLGETRNREGQDLDRGYNNIGVRRWIDDLGVGAYDPFGVPLSLTRLRPKSARFIAVDGAFKAPGLRNVELTAPYFHTGGHLTLESVVDFYSRGGDFATLLAVDGTEIRPLSVPRFSDEERAGLVAFLKSLTDERVLYRRAPFDHPQLFVPDGQLFDERDVAPDPIRPGQALDRMREIPGVGRDGGSPLPPFLAVDAFPLNPPMAGDFNGDGRSDLLWRNEKTGETSLWLMNGTAYSAGATLMKDVAWRPVLTGDFNGDGRTDIVWRNDSTGVTSIWLMNGLQLLAGATLLSDGNWLPTHAADLDGNGSTDIVWRNVATNQTALWLMNGMQMAAGTVFAFDGVAGWQVTHVADFDGDGRADLVARNTSTGATAMWRMNGLTSVGVAGLVGNGAWRVTHTGDLNGDGRADLVWHDASTGATSAWLMNGTTMLAGASLLASTDWHVVQTGDFDGDGRTDLVWRNEATGQTSMWLMNGLAMASGATILTHSDWQLSRVGNFDGNLSASGRPVHDLLWRNSRNGQHAVWLMSGTSLVSGATVLNGPAWSAVP